MIVGLATTIQNREHLFFSQDADPHVLPRSGKRTD